MRRMSVLLATSALAVSGLAALAVGAAPSVLADPGSASDPTAAAAPAFPAAASTGNGPGFCPPSGAALAYSDALDKVTVGGATVGGLSSLAYDRVTRTWASAVDNHGTDPARIWFFRDLLHPTVVGAPLVLRRPDGTAYDGTTADDEGLAVLPDGRFLVSSETEPSIRIFGRDGVQQASLPVPARFAVAPAGQATSNATLEGLTLTPSGRRIVAAMEGTLSGDTGDGTYRRFLVYDQGRTGAWALTREIGYRVQPGNRVPEVAAYGENSLLVEEAAFSTTTGNSVSLYAVTGLDRAPDVTRVPDLATGGPAGGAIVPKTLVADLVRCPSLGAPAKEPQTNPLLDNIEGMAFTTPVIHGFAGLSLISDDNFSATQTTRVVDLAARLP